MKESDLRSRKETLRGAPLPADEMIGEGGTGERLPVPGPIQEKERRGRPQKDQGSGAGRVPSAGSRQESTAASFRKAGRLLLRYAGLALLLLFFVLPLMKLAGLSLTEGAGAGFTLRHYEELLREPRLWKTLRDTAVIVAGASGLSLLLGAAAAWFMAYTDLRGKAWLHALLLLPFLLPSYVLTLSWSSLNGTQGWIAALLGMIRPEAVPWSIYSHGGIILVMGIHHFPLVYLLTLDTLRRIPREAEEAARASGLGRWKTLLLITLPLAAPGLTGGTLLAFLASLDNFGIPAFLGLPAGISVLSTRIYEETVSFGPAAFPRAASLSVLLAVIAAGGALLQRLSVRRSGVQETRAPETAARLHLGRWRPAAEAAFAGGLLLVTVLPLLSMTATSLKRAYGLPFGPANATLANYRYILLENPKVWRAIGNSLLLSGTAAAVILVLGTALAYLFVRRPSGWTRAAELGLALPYTLPGIVFGLAMILTWMEPLPGWNPGIYGSGAILLIAYICRFLVLQLRAALAAFAQVEPAMEEAARAGGSARTAVWRTVLLPLLLPGLAGGALLVFFTALTELTVSALLWSPGAETIGIVIFGFEQGGDTVYSTALSSLLVVLLAAGCGVLAGVRYIAGKRGIRKP
ncbi:ABC transporter permease [Paenibacillus sp. S-38]|uniref:ABC transporter permease n=1 Tax=Paenibacillus sp. S-38 TaxID=3416710 RepID=UPI003CE7EBF2